MFQGKHTFLIQQYETKKNNDKWLLFEEDMEMKISTQHNRYKQNNNEQLFSSFDGQIYEPHTGIHYIFLLKIAYRVYNI